MNKAHRQLSVQAAALMYWGVRLALGVLLTGVFAYVYNEHFLAGDYFCREMCLKIVVSAVSLFVQFIIGGFIFDCVKAKRE